MLAENLSDLFQRYLEIAYSGEQQIGKEMSKIVEVISSPVLRAAFEETADHCAVHASRLKQIFGLLNRAVAAETNHPVQSIMSESERLIKHIDRSPLLDSGMIILANQARHNEIVLYGALASLARLLGWQEIAVLLEQTLAEEKAADRELTQLAVNTVNPDAVGFQNSPHGLVII